MADDRCQPRKSASACSGSKGRQSGYGPHKRGLNTKLHLAVDAHGLPVRIIVTEGPAADCTHAIALIDGCKAEALLADKGYDTNEIVDYATQKGMRVVIPSSRRRKVARPYDEALYKLRHLVENAFLHLKRWRGVATRYAKNTASFIAAVQIRAIALWASIS